MDGDGHPSRGDYMKKIEELIVSPEIEAICLRYISPISSSWQPEQPASLP